MTTYYYTLSSLPMLQVSRLGEAPVISLDDFRNCCDLLTAPDRQELELFLAGDWAAGTSDFARRWTQIDTQIRDAAARLRASRLNVDPTPYLKPFSGYDVSTEREIAEAFNKPHALERELALDRCRWRLLDELSLNDPFGLPMALSYAVKLTMMSHWAELSDEKGQENVEQFIVDNLEREGSMKTVMAAL